MRARTASSWPVRPATSRPPPPSSRNSTSPSTRRTRRAKSTSSNSRPATHARSPMPSANLLRQQDPRGGQGVQNIRVVGEPASNCIMVAASPGDWQMVKTVIDQFIDKGQAQIVPTTRPIQIQHAKATEVAENLRQVFTNQPRGRPGERAPVPVIITANERSNMLLVSAAEDDQKTVAELVKMLDVPVDEQKVDPRPHHPHEGRRRRQGGRGPEESPAAAGAGQTQRVFIQADPASNSVIIRAPEGEYKPLADMVASLDTAIIANGGIKVFKLTVADAQQVATALQAALRRDTGGGRQINAGPPTVVTADTRHQLRHRQRPGRRHPDGRHPHRGTRQAHRREGHPRLLRRATEGRRRPPTGRRHDAAPQPARCEQGRPPDDDRRRPRRGRHGHQQPPHLGRPRRLADGPEDPRPTQGLRHPAGDSPDGTRYP